MHFSFVTLSIATLAVLTVVVRADLAETEPHSTDNHVKAQADGKWDGPKWNGEKHPGWNGHRGHPGRVANRNTRFAKRREDLHDKMDALFGDDDHDGGHNGGGHDGGHNGRQGNDGKGRDFNQGDNIAGHRDRIIIEHEGGNVNSFKNAHD